MLERCRRYLLKRIFLTDERIVPDLLKDYSTRQNYVGHLSAYEYAKRFVTDKRVLDVGCGAGYGAHFLAMAGAESVTGIDASDEVIQYSATRYRHPRVRFEQMDACDLRYTDASFDVVVSFQVIEHIKAISRFLAGLHRVVREGGYVILSTPNGDNPLRKASGGNLFHVCEYSIGELEAILKGVFPYVKVYVQVVTEEAKTVGVRMDQAAADSLLVRLLTSDSPFRRIGRLMPLAWRNLYFVKRTGFPWNWYNVHHIEVREEYAEDAFKLLAVCKKLETPLSYEDPDRDPRFPASRRWDRGLKVLRDPEPPGGVLHPLDDRVEGLQAGVSDPVA